MKKQSNKLPIQAIKKSSSRPKIFSQSKSDKLTVFERNVYRAVTSIPKGRISTYGLIAYSIGARGAARAVGNVLNKNIYANVPCHRVVQSDGGAGGYAWGRKNKISMIRREGVAVINGRIDLKKYGIWFNT